MTWVKVCGLSSHEDVATAIGAGADAVGFVIAESPRQVSVATVARLAKGVPATTTLVTMDLPGKEVDDLLEATGVDAIQPHGRHQADAAAAAMLAGAQVLYPTQLVGAMDWAAVPAGVLPMVDAPRPGSGAPFDWALIGHPGRPFVLAGGLTPENVAEAVEATRAWGVDVSSGVESAPGRKDPALVRAFVMRAKSR